MSIFNHGLKGFFQQKNWKQTFSGVDNVPQHIADPINKAIKDALQHIEDNVNNALKHITDEANTAGQQITSGINDTGNAVVDGLHKTRDSIQGEVVSNITRVGNNLVKKVEDGGQTALTTIENKITQGFP